MTLLDYELRLRVNTFYDTSTRFWRLPVWLTVNKQPINPQNLQFVNSLP